MKDDVEKQPNWKSDLLAYLPRNVRELLIGVDARMPLEEIRIRADAPLQLCFSGYERLIYAQDGAPAVTREDCRKLLIRLCDQSIYAWEAELSGGFLTLPGGYRVGVCGDMADTGGIRRLSGVSGFNIRIARPLAGCAAQLLPRLIASDGHLFSTLIVSAPGCGKTTMLRDVARSAAQGACGVRACRVAVVDTRYELAGCVHGTPRMDLGPRTDVLSGVPRAAGMRMMVTNMSPDVLVTDELSDDADARAVFDAVNCGVTVVASAHAGSMAALIRRHAMQQILAERLFDRIVLLGRSRGAGTVEQVVDAMFRPVPEREGLCSVRLLS